MYENMTYKRNTMVMTAMLAIASVALMPLVTSEAFATNDTNNYVSDVPTGQTETSDWDRETCIAAVSDSNCKSKLRVYNNNSSDKLKAYYSVINAECDVDIEWFKNGSSVATWGVDNYTGSGASISKWISFGPTDDWRTDTSYTNCTTI